MRAIILAGIAATGLASLGAATPAAAQMYPPDVPVCLQVFGRGSYTECRYASIAQCQLSASGRSAQCLENPYFVGRQAPGPRRERRVRREY